VKDSIFNHLLCKSGFANDRSLPQSDSYGKCGSRIMGYNAGKPCQSSSNCPTNDDLVNSDCLCTPNSEGKSRCEYEKGGTEWSEVIEEVAAAQQFRKYISITKTCHVTRGLDETCDVRAASYK